MSTRILQDERATRALGSELGRLARAGTVIALCGDLGAGKTVLAKGVGEGLGIPGPVTSPTFVLLAAHEDGGRLPLFHADFYRLRDRGELRELGLDELAGVEGVTVVEWADRFPGALPADRLEVLLEILGPTCRRARLVSRGRLSRELLDAITR